MTDPTFVDTPKGDQLVILVRADYEEMRVRLAAYEAMEDAADAALGERRVAEWEAQGRPAYPLDVMRLMRGGDSPLKAFRRHRKLTQQALAAQVGVGQGYLSDLEKGRKIAGSATLAALAVALRTNEASLLSFDSDES